MIAIVYFRYPISKDKNKDKKEIFLEKILIEVIQKEVQRGEKTLTLIVENSEGEVKKIYYHNSNKVTELFKILKNTSTRWTDSMLLYIWNCFNFKGPTSCRPLSLWTRDFT